MFFKGSIVALLTPMDDKGKICPQRLKKLVDYHAENGTDAIVASGTTGESATLSHEEQYLIVKMTIEFAEGRLPVIAGTGASATETVIKLSQKLENSGIAGCLVVTPYYNRPTQEGLYLHFKTIAENTDLPQILYNVPSRTGCDLLPETVARLATVKNIVGIKEATGDLSRLTQLRGHLAQKQIKKDFCLLSGDDATALDFLRLGGDGIISVVANVAARDMSMLCRLARAGDVIESTRLNQRLAALQQALFIESNPIPVKWAAKRLGLIDNAGLRLPLTPLSENGQIAVENALRKAGVL